MSEFDTISTFLFESSKACVSRLQSHTHDIPDLSAHPRLAAVLVLLYEQPSKSTGLPEIRVLLTTRSKTLRSHPGETALPGGKVDKTDKDATATALREAHEEVGLPLNSPSVHIIGTLEPFLASSRILVTPVLAFLTDPEPILQNLRANPDEVAHVFTHPLEAFLQPELARDEPLVELGGDHWPFQSEFHEPGDKEVAGLGNTLYKMHRFRSSASPIKGLTADILIMTAEIAFDRPTAYVRYCEGQWRGYKDVRRLLDTFAVPL